LLRFGGCRDSYARPAPLPMTTVWSYGSVNQASQVQRADFLR
jgi:hypothetical protein